MIREQTVQRLEGILKAFLDLSEAQRDQRTCALVRGSLRNIRIDCKWELKEELKAGKITVTEHDSEVKKYNELVDKYLLKLEQP
jgi:ribosome recycling factor